MIKNVFGFGLAIACTFLLAHEAKAAADSAASSEAPALEEVVVTAQRRVERLQDVPLAATVLSGKDLSERGITGIDALQTAAPGLSVNPPGNGETFVNIRGIGTIQTTPTTSAGVAFYIDHVFLPIQRFVGDGIFDVGSVEILRGPQGTLVGENSTGGAILVNSAQPDLGGISGYYQQTIGSYQRRREEGAINMPLSDVIAVRASFAMEKRNSFTENLGSGDPTVTPNNSNQPGNINTQSARVQLLFRPNEDFDLTLRYDNILTSDDGPAIKPVANPLTDPFSASIQNQPFKIGYDTPGYAKVDGSRESMEINYTFVPAATLRSITSYADSVLKDSADTDYGRSQGAAQNGSFVRQYAAHIFTQELNLISRRTTAFDWVLGAFYLQSAQPLALTDLGTPAPGFPVLPLLRIQTDTYKKSSAVFGQGTYKLTEALSLTLGARYSHDSAPFTGVTTVLGPTGFLNLPTDSTATSSKTTVRAVVDWNVTSDILLYGSYATGYKAGGANLQGFVSPPPYTPEETKVFELGVKSTYLDHRLRTNLAAFTQKYDGLQVLGTLANFPLTVNAPRSTINGFEAELNAAFGQLRVDSALTYLDAVTKDAFAIPTGIVTPGSQLPYASKWSGNVAIEYDFSLPKGSISPRLQYDYASPRYTALTHGPYTETDAREALDARLIYKAPKFWTVEGYVTNLTNRTYIIDITAAGLQLAGVTGLTYAPPREFGGRFSYRF